jgi:hypothetical protein
LPSVGSPALAQHCRSSCPGGQGPGPVLATAPPVIQETRTCAGGCSAVHAPTWLQGLLTIRTLVTKLSGICFSIAAGLIAGVDWKNHKPKQQQQQQAQQQLRTGVLGGRYQSSVVLVLVNCLALAAGKEGPFVHGGGIVGGGIGGMGSQSLTQAGCGGAPSALKKEPSRHLCCLRLSDFAEEPWAVDASA